MSERDKMHLDMTQCGTGTLLIDDTGVKHIPQSDIKIKTKSFKNTIEQETIFPEDLRNHTVKRVIDLEEAGIREALMSMGWIPPDETKQSQMGRLNMKITKHETTIRLIHKDLLMRADEEGVVDLSDFIWQRVKRVVGGG